MTVIADAPRTNEFLLLCADGDGGLALARLRRRDVLLARLWHRALDRRLAAGAAPESSRLLATRARQLVGAPVRRRLARRWQALLVHARGEVADELAGLVAALRADRSAAARGVALADVLLPVALSGARRIGHGGEDVVSAAVRTARAALR